MYVCARVCERERHTGRDTEKDEIGKRRENGFWLLLCVWCASLLLADAAEAALLSLQRWNENGGGGEDGGKKKRGRRREGKSEGQRPRQSLSFSSILLLLLFSLSPRVCVCVYVCVCVCVSLWA